MTSLRYLGSVATVAAIATFYFKVIHVATATVSTTFLLAVLVISAFWGLRYAVLTSLLATLTFNYFFLPPIGTFVIADPQNWVALFAFLTTALIASHLSERARSAAMAADRRRHELEQLYGFSQQLLSTQNILELLNAIPALVVEEFDVKGAAILLSGTQKIYYSDLMMQDVLGRDELGKVLGRGEPVLDATRSLSFWPLRVGVRPSGVIVIAGRSFSRETLDALAGLIAIAIEHVQAAEKLNKSEAAREGERLRSALLDSVTHEFRTPLTGIKASVTTLLSDVALDTDQKHELLTIIEEGSDRINRLIGEATEMAQLDAGKVALNFEPHDIGEAIEVALERRKQELGRHPVDVTLPPDLPLVRMDVVRIAEVIEHFLTNAAKYSPSNTPIHITAGFADGRLTTSVADHGPGIDEFEQSLIFEKFYRGPEQRSIVPGTGMGLAIAKAIVEAHGGTIGVVSQLGRGSVFHFSLLAQS